MIYESVNCSLLVPDERELAARLSADPNVAVPNVNEYFEEILKSATPMYVADCYEMKKTDKGIYVGNILIKSRGFERFAEGYNACILLVCTLGLSIDKRIMKASVLSSAEAFILDAVADVYTEALYNYARLKLTRGYRASLGFSPGYADFDLDIGEKIVKMTGADKVLGIKFTEGGLMIPKKSISTVICIGLSNGEVYEYTGQN